jgi:hypothetical protein
MKSIYESFLRNKEAVTIPIWNSLMHVMGQPADSTEETDTQTIHLYNQTENELVNMLPTDDINTSENTTPTPFTLLSSNNTSSLVSPGNECEYMPCPTTIRHLVISGGGEMGFAFYSVLRDSHKSGFWNIQNI